MDTFTFDIEYHSETSEFTDILKSKVAHRLEKLARQHHDITGASLAVHTLNGAHRQPKFKVRLVLYHKPDNIAVIRKGEAVAKAVAEALDAVERKVRDHRERVRTQRRQAKI